MLKTEQVAPPRTIRVLILLEATSFNGVVKVLVNFAEHAMNCKSSCPRLDISFVAFQRGEANYLATILAERGIQMEIVKERWRFDARVISQLRSIIEKYRPNIILSNNVKSHFLVRLAHLNRSCSWVAYHHGYTQTDFKMRLYNQLDRWSLREADRVISVCRFFAQDLMKRRVNPGRISILHNAIIPAPPAGEEQQRELRSALRIDECTKVLLAVGRLSREKGHSILIKAMAKVLKCLGSRTVRLVIVGEGPERTRIEELSLRLGLAGNVTLVGEQNDVNPYYAIADVFILPSHSEGSPNALLEAMAAGVPIVATAVGGVPEMVSDRREVVLVRKNDSVGLSSAIIEVLEDEELRNRLSRAAHENVSQRRIEQYFRAMMSVFNSVQVEQAINDAM